MQSFIIQNANIFRPDNFFHKGDLKISVGKITNEISSDEQIHTIDAENLYIIPGLTDIHFHGANGHDFCEGTPEAFNAISDYEARHGITTICPATMTLPEKELARIMNAAKNFSEIAGINLEGPFISPHKIGAQNPAYVVRPSFDMLEKLQAISGGLIKIAVVAPEVEGAEEFIARAKNIARISIAHTNCDYETAKKAFELGARHVTHLYDAMNGINHREPGPILAALENENVNVELICDGVHIHPAVVRMTLKIFGPDRIIFISDSMEATGKPDGNYELGGLKVIKRGKKATLTDGKTIAGSASNLMDCMITAVKEMQIPLEIAVKCAAVNPVKAIGLENVYGSLQEGRAANIVALDTALNVIFVMKEGKIIRENS